MGKEPKKLDELFHDTLKDIYYAEKKVLTALPKMAKAAQNRDLKAAFEKHEGETEEQVLRLEQVFEMIDKKAQGKKCPAIDGIIEEGQEVAKEYKGSPALDSGLLAAAQAVEYYEISRYGTLRTWAQELGLKKAVQLLETTLKEEKNTDETLTELAETCVNQEGQEHPHGNRGCGLDHSQHEDDEKGPEGDENGAGMAPRKGCRRLHLFLRSSCVPFRTSRKDPISISVNSHHRLWAWLEFAALYRLCAGDYVSGMGRARN